MATIKKYDTIFYVFQYFWTIYRSPWVTSCYENLLSSIACELGLHQKEKLMPNYIPTNQFFKKRTRICQSSKNLSHTLNELVITLQKDENGWTTLVYLYSSLNLKRYDKMHYSWHSS
jgi:hypothetical protein